MAKTVKEKHQERARRTRSRLAKVANGRPRLSIHRSSKNIAAQVIDDNKSRTLVSASTLDQDFKGQNAKGSDTAAATVIGKLIAERALKAGVEEVIFDRGGYIYHGRVKALAEAAREAGLKF